MESNGNPIDMPPQEDLTEVKKPTSLLVAQLFLFPLIVIGFGVGVFLLFGYITQEQKSPQAYLNEIRLGSETRRWQAAFELSKVIAAQKEELQSAGFARDIIDVYKNAGSDNPQIRQFLAISLGHLGDRTAIPALTEGLNDSAAETQIWTLWAIGTIGDKEASAEVVGKLQSDDAAVRKMAVYVLGALKDPSTARNLRVALNDGVADVRWNAAMALAQLNDAAGADILIELTNRAYLDQFLEMSLTEKENAIVNAVKCLSILKLEGAKDKIESLSQSDPSMVVRDAALEAMNTF